MQSTIISWRYERLSTACPTEAESLSSRAPTARPAATEPPPGTTPGVVSLRPHLAHGQDSELHLAHTQFISESRSRLRWLRGEPVNFSPPDLAACSAFSAQLSKARAYTRSPYDEICSYNHKPCLWQRSNADHIRQVNFDTLAQYPLTHAGRGWSVGVYCLSPTAESNSLLFLSCGSPTSPKQAFLRQKTRNSPTSELRFINLPETNLFPAEAIEPLLP
ncbi:hypothetical protein FALBO_7420 [Fusarium albosuccineum]|uniref:Uncharacterized protein n=1 Tax=Fusarium albosuccineum TaxID=1237068 RepID=A0A8H4LCQ9_9HYPO|nr:hypothetical protein FALBO_7420 [Fusarium albosuccineum]